MSRDVIQAGTVWRFPASGFAAAMLLAVVPGSPLAVSDWPLRGPFGAFTWIACFVSTGLCLTLVLLAMSPARGVGGSRVVMAGLAFGLLALGSYAAAARADRIVQSPLAALTLVLAGLFVLRAVAVRVVGSIAGARPPAAPSPPLIVKAPGTLRTALTGLALAAALAIGVAALVALAVGLAKPAPAPAGAAAKATGTTGPR
jgi:hypothetical protein